MLSIAGIVAIVVFTIQAYKTANGTGRNGALWAFLTAAIGVIFQFVLPVIMGIVIGVYYMMTSGSVDDIESALNGYALILGIVFFIISIVGMWLVMKHVSKVPDDPPMSASAPPPPPTF